MRLEMSQMCEQQTSTKVEDAKHSKLWENLQVDLQMTDQIASNSAMLLGRLHIYVLRFLMSSNLLGLNTHNIFFIRKFAQGPVIIITMNSNFLHGEKESLSSS